MRYLNNSGTRWISDSKKDMEFILHDGDKPPVIRRAVCFEQFGNFAVIVYRVKGKTFKAFGKTCDGTETYGDDEPGLPHVFHSPFKPGWLVK